MNTYTIIADFRGGTYVSQVESESIKNCLREWLKVLRKDLDDIQYLGERTLLQLESEIKNSDPGQLRGLKNVWCDVLLTKQGAFLLNIVQTDFS